MIDSEREYQDRKWGSLHDHPHEVGGWLSLMRTYLAKAEAAWAGNNHDREALKELRKVLAIGVACAEQHGMEMRSNTQPVDSKRSASEVSE
ncbi:MAG: hypothetical protein ACLFTX_06485 [Thiohalospira sp.]